MSQNNFTGEFQMDQKDPGTVTTADMPRNVRAQAGMGDLQEQFRDVTRGFETMHMRVREPPMDPMVEFDPSQDYDDIQRDADMAAQGAVDPLTSARPLGSVADIDAEIVDIAGDEFDIVDGGGP